MQNRGRVFTRDQIMSHVWNTKYIEGTRTVDVHVRRLRYKLGAYAEYLRTVKNVGYGLVEP
jgi:DNA-binding response OmpR family regulator